MKPKHSKAKQKGNMRSKKARRDDDVMNTNDSSIVSKRSVSRLYLSDEPDYYGPFTPKFVRRNPLINRGYWLRMHAIEQVVRRFLEQGDKSKVVVNLGCGYDPLPFQFWHRYESLTKNATFVDVDYPQLIEKKRDRVLSNSLLRDALFKTHVRPSTPPVHLRSERYLAMGCDLRDLVTLEAQLRAELNMDSCSVLFVSEVALTYMPVTDSDALIRFASTFEDARFCILEQYLPQGPDHPFARTMLAHFKKLQASIYAIERYLTLEQQASRFLGYGWTSLHVCQNLWDLWSDDAFTPPSLRRKLDSVEPFDEWEEFALYGAHYFLLEASNAKLDSSTETSGLIPDTRTPGSVVDTSEKFKLCHQTDGFSAMAQRRFAAIFKPDQDSLAIYGGQGHRGRLSDVDVLKRETTSLGAQTCLARGPPARMCHTITSLGDGKALLVGGRGSPSEAFEDSWLIRDGVWTKVDNLATGCYRHCTAAVTLKGDTSRMMGVLVFGGKASDGTVLDDWLLWTEQNGWHSIPIDGDGPRPTPRFGAAISTMDSGHSSGLLVGGMCESGTVLEDIWAWTVSTTPTFRITFKERTNEIGSNRPMASHGRVGASLVPWGNTSNTLMLIGGVSKAGIHSLSEDFLLLTCSHAEVSIRAPSMQLPSTWPLLVGVGVVSASPNEVTIVAGGAVCFSMGGFWNKGYFTVTKAGTEVMGPWRLAQPQTYGTAEAKPPAVEAPTKRLPARPKKKFAFRTKAVPRISLKSAEDFAEVVAASKPVVIEGLDIGPCTDLWTVDYLKEKIGADRELVVHECSSDRMTFKDKNFQYVKRSASDFLDGIAQGSKSYLRAVSSTQPNKLPTKIEEDFPTIAADFRLTEIFDAVKANYHSSPLRISGPVSLWLHYDVLSNILCQIRGTKTLHLYPPSDVKYLDYPPGGSSSNIDILASNNPKLHPHIATLTPGDILFIPPMWSHTATPNDGVSVAVNVFWKDLEKGYAAGKDVYGNRDLQAYENGRRDVEKIIRAFRDIPEDIAGFYLERLAGEILDGADRLGRRRGKGEERENGL